MRFAHDLDDLLVAEMNLSHWTSLRLKPQHTTGANFLSHSSYPYEFASKAEIIEIMRMHGFDIVTMIPTEGLTGRNELVFQKV